MGDEFREEQKQYLILHLSEDDLRRIASSLVGTSPSDSVIDLRERLSNVTHGKLIQKIPKANLLAYLAVVKIAPCSPYVADLRAQVLSLWDKESARRAQNKVAVTVREDRSVQSHQSPPQQQRRREEPSPPAQDDLGQRAARDFSSLFYNLISLPSANTIIQMGFFCDDALLQLQYRDHGCNQVQGRQRVEELLRQLMSSASFTYSPSKIEGYFDDYGVLHVHVKGQVSSSGTVMVFEHAFQLVRLGSATHFAIKSADWRVGCPNDRLQDPTGSQALKGI